MITTWEQRPARTPLPDSTTTKYRGCLDALIATIADMRQARASMNIMDAGKLGYVTDLAEARAADCAHRLFERWIEVRTHHTSSDGLTWG